MDVKIGFQNERMVSVKKILQQIFWLEQRVQKEHFKLEQLESETQRLTVALQQDVVDRTRNMSSLEDSVIKVSECRERLNSLTVQVVDLRTLASAIICAIDFTKQRDVLTMRYIDCKSWNEIIEEMYDPDLRDTEDGKANCKRSLMRIHGRALVSAQKILDKMISEHEVDLETLKIFSKKILKKVSKKTTKRPPTTTKRPLAATT